MPHVADDNKKIPSAGMYREAHAVTPKSQRTERPPVIGRIAAIEHAVRVQNWDEARRLATREDSGDEI